MGIKRANQVNTRLSAEERAMLAQVAEGMGLAPSAVVRVLVRERYAAFCAGRSLAAVADERAGRA